MILIVLVIFIIIGIATFLFSLSRSVDQSQYLNIYAHNMLLTMVRSDTGYDDSNCRLISDAVSCTFFNPHRTCGATTETCEDVAFDRINRSVHSFDLISKNMRYLLVIKPSGFVSLDRDNITVGDVNLLTDRVTKYTAIERIQKVLTVNRCNEDYRFYLDCKRRYDRGEDLSGDACQSIIGDFDDLQDQYGGCLRASGAGSHTLKATLYLALK